ncbi:MAG: hypothetical protein ABIL44_01140 [candidate division WOR-3 bacterium]
MSIGKRQGIGLKGGNTVLKITKSAYQIIKEESLNSEIETGGILVGTLNHPCVIRATKPGSLAKRTAVSYTNDYQYDTKLLEEIISEFDGRVKLIGFWHKHPGTMNNPSLLDLKTVNKIIEEIKTQGDERLFFFAITNVVANEVALYCYCLKNQGFTPVATKIIDDNSEELKKILAQEPMVIIPKKIDYWNEPKFQFHLTKNGFERLKKEIDALIAQGYQVDAYHGKELKIVIKKDNDIIICQPPVEYPLNPPRFYKDNAEIVYNLPIWNSSFMIVDIIKFLERSTYESHSNKTSFGLCRFIERTKRAIKSLWNYKRRRGINLCDTKRSSQQISSDYRPSAK